MLLEFILLNLLIDLQSIDSSKFIELLLRKFANTYSCNPCDRFSWFLDFSHLETADLLI